MAILKNTLAPPGSGSINPALKFSKSDLLTVNGNCYGGADGGGGSVTEISRLSTSSDSEESEPFDGIKQRASADTGNGVRRK